MKAVITAAAVSAAVLLQGCNVYIDVPVTVGPQPTVTNVVDVTPTPIATTIISATPEVTAEPEVTPVPATPVVTAEVTPTPVVTPEPTPEPTAQPTPVNEQVHLMWSPPLQREDGTTLTEAELAEYVIRYQTTGATSFEEVRLPATYTSTTLELPAGEYEFQIAVVDTDGLMSDFVSAAKGI
ncbi:hypothetical protein [Salinibius halmophilus]|uniref:hypothetical protein n=1 Tax=Salinibius halmophilus TaxID=1853216 RepID=UPI000E661C9C|nr:hypothetical protein [Salinibius halmophilus]